MLDALTYSFVVSAFGHGHMSELITLQEKT
jgi:hypothetical protein